MTTADIKVRIHNIIDTMPDEELKELLVILEKADSGSINEKQVEIARRIIANNRPLMQKLAQ